MRHITIKSSQFLLKPLSLLRELPIDITNHNKTGKHKYKHQKGILDTVFSNNLSNITCVLLLTAKLYHIEIFHVNYLELETEMVQRMFGAWGN